MKSAGQILQQAFHGKPNPLTPNVLDYGNVTPTRVWELSTDYHNVDHPSGICSLYGVTVVDYDPATDTIQHNRELSQPFNSVQEARAYIQQLKDKADR